MSSSKKLLQSASGFINQSGGDNIEDYFDVTHWRGTGNNAYIRSNVDMTTTDGNKAMVMIKNTDFQCNWSVSDNQRGLYNQIILNNTDYYNRTDQIVSWLDYGFRVGAHDWVNRNTNDIVAYSWRCKPKFFDIQTYSGSGSSGQVINHDLGMVPGMFIIRAYNGQSGWVTWHKGGLGASGTNLSTTNEDRHYQLNTDGASTGPGGTWLTSVTDSAVTLASQGWSNYNDSNYNYVMYLFGDYEDDTSFIKCGQYTGTGTNNYQTVVCGFEPQWILAKNAQSTENWFIWDTKRGIVNEEPTNVDGDWPLYTNHGYGSSERGDGISVTADGFRVNGGYFNQSNVKYLFTAVKRGYMGTPTDYREVFNYDIHTNDPKNPLMGRNMRNPADFGWWSYYGSHGSMRFNARILQKNELRFQHNYEMSSPNLTHPENYAMFNPTHANTGVSPISGSNEGVTHPRTDVGWYISPINAVNSWGFTRWKGICDIQTYRTTGTSNLNTVKHNLGAVPEFMFTKGLYGGTGNWVVYHKDQAASNAHQYYLGFNSQDAATNQNTNVWGNAVPTDEHFKVYTDSNNNHTTYQACVWVGFASYPDRVDVGYYTGTGGTANRSIQTTLSGYVKMVLIKPVSQSGGWHWTDAGSNGYYWIWNYGYGRLGTGGSAPVTCASSQGNFTLIYNPSHNHDSSLLGTFPLNKSGVRYIYVAFG